MLKQALACVQSHQSLHCSRTYTQWVYTWHSYQSMLKQALACVQSHQSLHCSRTYTRWAYKRHILSVNAQTRLSLCEVLPEPLLLSHMRKMGVHRAYSFSQYSDETKYSCSLARAFTALTHAQNGRTYGIFHQSMLWRATEHSYRLARAFTALAYAQNGRTYGIFYQSMLKQALACVQSHQGLHCSRTYTKWAYIRHILSVNAQTRLSLCEVLPEPLLLSHMHKMGVHMAYFCSQCSNET